MLLEVEGEGENLLLHFYTNNNNMRFEISVDKKFLEISAAEYFTTEDLNAWGYTNGTPGISLLAHAAEPGDNVMIITLPFTWQEKLKIHVVNVSVAARDAVASLMYHRPFPTVKVQEPQCIQKKVFGNILGL